MKKINHTIWGTNFLDCKLYLEHIKKLYPNGEYIKDAFIKKDLVSIFKNHKFKKLNGEKLEVKIVMHPLYSNRCFFIKDETEKNFLFSIDNLKVTKEINWIEELAKILRNSIRKDIIKIKSRLLKENGPYCKVIGRKFNTKDLVIDHMPPYNFNIIMDTWIKSKELKVDSKAFKVNQYGILDLVDEKLKIDFRVYHSNISKGHLRLISKKVNRFLSAEFKVSYQNNISQQLSLF